MRNDDSYEMFVREVSRRATAFKKAMDQMLLAIAVTSPEVHEESAESMEKAAQDLCNILAEKDWPSWLKPLHAAVSDFLLTPTDDSSRKLISEIIRQFTSVKPARVIPDCDGESPYHFDKFYDDARSESKIAELFDAHIDALAQIIESGEIESVTALDALIQLVSTLKANRDASYAAVKQSAFLARYIHNVVLIYLKKLPLLGALVEAAEKTLQELESGVADVEKGMESRLKSALGGSLPRIDKVDVIIEREVRALPAPVE